MRIDLFETYYKPIPNIYTLRLTVLDNISHLQPDSKCQVAQVICHINQSCRNHVLLLMWAPGSGRSVCSGFGLTDMEKRVTGERTLTFPLWLQSSGGKKKKNQSTQGKKYPLAISQKPSRTVVLN